jgi:hypothetical protein
MMRISCGVQEKITIVRTGGNNSLQRVKIGNVNGEDILKKRIDALEN